MKRSLEKGLNRQHGVPRKRKTYREWRRGNAIKWFGVTPDRYEPAGYTPEVIEKVEDFFNRLQKYAKERTVADKISRHGRS